MEAPLPGQAPPQPSGDPPLVDAPPTLDLQPPSSGEPPDGPDGTREMLMQEDSARDIELSTPTKTKQQPGPPEEEGADGSLRPPEATPRGSRPRSALFGGLRPEGSLKARAIALIREQHMQKMNQDDKKAKVAAREDRCKVLEQEKLRFQERLAKQKERQQAEEKASRRKRAEAARRRAQRRQQQTESDVPSRPASAASDATPSEAQRPSSATAPTRDQQGGESSSQPGEPPGASKPPQFGSGMFTVFVKYRGMPRSQSRVPVSLDDHEYATMTVLRLKEHIASLTGVHSHMTCQVVLEATEGLADLPDTAAVADVLQHGANLILQLHLGSNSSGGRPPSARQQASEGWLQHQGRAALWRGHQMDSFPKDLRRLSKDQMTRLLRQASVHVSCGLRDEDLRKELGVAAGAWEVERILACETPSQVLRVPGDAAPVTVKTAFRKLSMLVHPDKNQHQNAIKAMQSVTAAFRSLYLDGSPTKPKAKTTTPPARPSSVPPGAQRDWTTRVPRPMSTRFSRREPPVWPTDGSESRPKAPTWVWQEEGIM